MYSPKSRSRALITFVPSAEELAWAEERVVDAAKSLVAPCSVRR